ncbi:DUF397 domain-containing protein [Streptomyces hydrogenans]|uniref:DUF397 domain-containing protein n=1 Tax=Streptomyces hydrogenans TaxID=1873719 RepID=UPI0038179E56
MMGTSELDWFKSSYSNGGNGETCVEVAHTPHAIHVRDSKNTPGPRLAFAPAAWVGFVEYSRGE